jgi:broad-specificity NMP kinase
VRDTRLILIEGRPGSGKTTTARLLADSPYARRRNLRGMDGALTFIGDYRTLVDELRSVSRLHALVLETCEGQWDVCQRQILDFLGV